MADTTTETRTTAEIVEQELSGELATACSIHEIQVAAENFTEEFRNPHKPGRPVMWDVVDYHGIPRDFFELCLRVADYEVRL